VCEMQGTVEGSYRETAAAPRSQPVKAESGAARNAGIPGRATCPDICLRAFTVKSSAETHTRRRHNLYNNGQSLPFPVEVMLATPQLPTH
jgi:hypothetical protein